VIADCHTDDTSKRKLMFSRNGPDNALTYKPPEDIGSRAVPSMCFFCRCDTSSGQLMLSVAVRTGGATASHLASASATVITPARLRSECIVLCRHVVASLCCPLLPSALWWLVLPGSGSQLFTGAHTYQTLIVVSPSNCWSKLVFGKTRQF
jgi:hypothetical protein